MNILIWRYRTWETRRISFHTGGWLRYDLKGEELGRKTSNDLQYSYLSFKSKTDNAIVNLGRVMVFEGVAAERVDGIYGRTDLRYNLAVSAFGGVPVETLIETPGNNQIYGTQAFTSDARPVPCRRVLS